MAVCRERIVNDFVKVADSMRPDPQSIPRFRQSVYGPSAVLRSGSAQGAPGESPGDKLELLREAIMEAVYPKMP